MPFHNFILFLIMQKSNNELAERALAFHVGQHLVDFVSPQINDANTFLVYLPNLERFPASGCDLMKDISWFFFPIYPFFHSYYESQ